MTLTLADNFKSLKFKFIWMVANKHDFHLCNASRTSGARYLSR